jgi:hypothetical protein
LINPSDADYLERDIKGSRKVILDTAGQLSGGEQLEEFNREFLKAP